MGVDLGTKEEGRKLLAVGGYAKSARVCGEGTHVTRTRSGELQRKEESIRVVHGRGEGKAKYCCGGIDTEEMRKWRCLSQSEVDSCWKNLAEKMEEEVLDK